MSGTTLVDDKNSSYIHRLMTKVDPSTDYALVVCQLSTNDASKGKTLGEISSSRNLEDFDTKTIVGAIEYIIAYVQKTWNCPVVFYTNAKFDSSSYGIMVQQMSEIQEKWGIGVIDLWSDASFNDISEEERSLYMYDSIHPTKAGYRQWWCPEIERQLLLYMEHDQKE